MILALLLAAAEPVAMPESADDRLFRLGEETHLLQMRLHDEFFDNPANRSRLVGDGFAPACAAHFLAFRKVEPRYAAQFRPIVIQSMRKVVPADRLAAARFTLGHDPAILAWRSRVEDQVREKAAALLARATKDYDRELASQLKRVADLPLPKADAANRSAMNAPQLAIACFSYFGNNRETILAIDKSGETL